MVHYFLSLKKKVCQTTVSSQLNIPNSVQIRRYLMTLYGLFIHIR